LHRNRTDIAKFLFCLGILEGKAFQLFGRISDKVEQPLAKYSLLYVAYDSLKNSVILGELGKSFSMSEVKAKDYEKILGGVWKMVEKLSRDTLKVNRITSEALVSFADKLIGTYTMMIVQLKTLRFMSREISEAYDVDLDILHGIFDLLIEDEETDGQVLMALKDLSLEKPSAVVDRPPPIKYTDPDRWYEPETRFFG
jgi:hypothetical protein